MWYIYACLVISVARVGIWCISEILLKSLDFFAVFFCYFSCSSRIGVSRPCAGLDPMYKLILDRSKDSRFCSSDDFSKAGVI
jgi:hypothetical protein